MRAMRASNATAKQRRRCFPTDISAHRQRIAVAGPGPGVDAEVAAVYGPGLTGVGGIGGGGPVVLRHREAAERCRLVEAAVGVVEGIVEIVRMIALLPVGQTLELVAGGHPPGARGGAVAQAALAALRLERSTRIQEFEQLKVYLPFALRPGTITYTYPSESNA